jgi:hypothetical protein
MANKNQKRLRVMLHKDGNVEIQVPSGGYHGTAKGVFHTRTIEGGRQVRLSRAAKVGNPNAPDSLRGPSLHDQAQVAYWQKPVYK